MATKIYCAATDCEFNGDKGICTAKKVALSWSSIMTLWDGRQQFNKCKTYQKSMDAIKIENMVAEMYANWREENKGNIGGAASE